MELQKVNGQQGLSAKENMVKFVHDVAEMEIQVTSLREMAARTRNDILNIHLRARDHILNDLRNKIAGLNKRKRECESNINNCNARLQKEDLGQLRFQMAEEKKKFLYQHPYVGLYILIIPFIIMQIVWLYKYDSVYENLCKTHKSYNEEAIQRYRNNITRIEAEIHDLEGQIEEEIQNRDYLRNQSPLALYATHLEQKADEISHQVNELYKIGMIPPDYCRAERAIVLDYVFRNDQADTMREATLLCDQALRHADIMRGIHSIVSVLKQIAASMQGIQRTVETINMNVSMISQDLSKISEKMDDMTKMQAESIDQQNRLISETRGARYAAEAVQENNRKYEWYIDQHRKGFM